MYMLVLMIDIINNQTNIVGRKFPEKNRLHICQVCCVDKVINHHKDFVQCSCEQN